MIKVKYEEYIYYQYNTVPLKATFYPSEQTTPNKTILYFHGGGLLYGSRTDIPETYISTFLDAGYHFLAFDYLLAPESSLEDIYFSAKEAVKWFLNEHETTLSIKASDYILFGRSAGAFLCFLLARDSSLPSAKQLINFYGYDSLSYKDFQKRNTHYLSYPIIPKSMIKRMIQDQPIAHGPIQARFSLYLYARQTGKWLEFLQVNNANMDTFSLSKEDKLHFPPTFTAHSKEDSDVPYSIAESLNDSLPDNHLHTVEKGEHDFDRNQEAKEAQKAYRVLLSWLNRPE